MNVAEKYRNENFIAREQNYHMCLPKIIVYVVFHFNPDHYNVYTRFTLTSVESTGCIIEYHD